MNSACLPNSLMPQPLLPPPPPSSATPTNTTPSMDHNSSLSDSPSKPENGLRINYQGSVSLLAHAPMYGGGNGDVSTTLDDSREERGWTTDDQMSPKEQSSSPDALPKSQRSDDEMMERPSGDSLERLREICNKSLPQHGNTMIDTANNETLQADGSTLFNCHLCSFTSVSRDEFNEHVNDHYEFRCPKCDFDTKSEPEYRTHLKEEHNLTPEDLDDDQGIRVPKINSQGKVKVFKCKQCEFVAVTKEDFWRHSKVHIKPEKMLNCPKCPFVTEYKHHLEYHLRNHFGSKPFKCPNPGCTYTCVNKSMLNSHMKSHTNIYQYRCADCNYATKYCHSLKLHLRKYTHKPAMVLNPDGTPNPLPIIDVYGTRRGPKKKPGESEGNSSLSPDGSKDIPASPTSPRGNGDHLGAVPGAPRFPLLPPFVMAQMQMQMQQSLNQSGSPTRIAQVPPFSRSATDDYMSSLSPVRRMNERGDSSEMEEDENGLNDSEKPKLKCAICDFETASHDIYRNHLMLHATKDPESPPPSAINLPQYPLQIRSPLAINAAAKASALLRRERPLSSSNESESEAPSSSIKQEESALGKMDAGMDYLEYIKKMAPLFKQNMSPSPMVSSTQQAASASPPVVTGATSELISRLYFGNMVKNLQAPPQQNLTPTTSGHPPDADSSSGALDLSQLNKQDPPSRPQSGSQTSTVGSSGKSRRKGKAYKIERKLLSADDRDSLNSGHSEYSNEQDEEVKSDGSSTGKEPGTTTGPNGTHLEEENGTGKNLNGSHVCKFCEIAFMDSIMFTIHMGYHGFQNPYKCNMCGEECSDRVGFFLHIARKAHQ